MESQKNTTLKYLAILVITISFISFSKTSQGQRLNADFYSTSGDVYDIEGNDSFIYIGGLFNYIGVNAGGLATFSENNDRLIPGLPDLGYNPTIHAVCSDSQGGWYIAGHYTHANKIPQEGITHILSDNSVDRRFKPPVINFMNYTQLLFDGKHLYLAGEFTYVYGSNTYKNLVRLDPVTGAFDEHWNPSPSGRVILIEEIDDLIYASGTFVFIGEHFQKNMAAISKNTGKYVTSFACSELPNFMHRKNDSLFIGKNDLFIAGIEAFNNAIISNGKKDLLLRRFPTEEKVYKSIPDGKGGWYVAGDFSNLDNVFTNNIGHISNDLTSNPSFVQSREISFSSNKCELLSHSNYLYMAGDFKLYYNGNLYQNLMRFNLFDGQIDTNFNPEPDTSVYAIHIENNILYFGGRFTYVNGQVRNHLAAINLLTNDLSSWNPGADNTVFDIKPYKNGFFVAGEFGSIASQARVAFAAFNKSGAIQNIFLNFSANAKINELICSDSFVYMGGDFCISHNGKSYCDLAAYNFRLFNVGNFRLPDISFKSTNKEWNFAYSYDSLFVSGNFDSINHTHRNFVAAINRHNSKLLNWDIKPDNQIDDMSISYGKMMISGDFNYLMHVQSPLVYISTKQATINKVPIHIGLGELNDLSWRSNDFVIAGRFDSINHSLASNIAAIKLNGQFSNWKIQETANEVNSIISANDRFFLLSENEFLFDTIKRSYVASINHSDGKLNNWNAGFNKMPNILTISDSVIMGTGDFTFVNGKRCSNFARIDRASGQIDSWLPKVNGKIFDIELISDTVLIGGSFTAVNNSAHDYFCGLSSHKNSIIGNTSLDLEGGQVHKIHANKNSIFVGGSFKKINGFFRPALFSLNRSNFQYNSWNYDSLRNATNLKITAIETFEDQLIINGSLLWPDGFSYAILSFDVNSGACLHKIKEADLPISNDAVGFSIFDSNLYCGSILSPNNKSLYKINLNTFERENWNTSTEFPIKDLKVFDSNLWAIGDFVKNKGFGRLEIISPKFDSSLLKINLPISYGTFNSMFIDSSDLFLGGDFLEIEGLSNSRLANYSGVDKLLVPGIHSIYPEITSNYNILKFNLNGYGFQKGSLVRFKKGFNTLYPDSLVVGSSSIQGILILNNADTGYYNVMVYLPNGAVLTLRNALLVETAEKPDFWIDLLGPETVLAFHPYNYILSYGNNSNAGFLGVPMAMAIPDTVIFSYGNEYLYLTDSSGVLDSIKTFVISDTLIKEYLPNSKVYGFIIPYLGPKSTGKINLTLNVPIDDWYVAYCIGQPLYSYNDNRSKEFIINTNAKDYLFTLSKRTSIQTDIITLEEQANKLSDELYEYLLDPDFPTTAPVLSQSTYFGKLLYACDSQTKIDQDAGVMMSYFFNGGGTDTTKTKYVKGFLLKLKKITGVYARDPNVKYGPSDYYVKGNEQFRYMITFENDKNATAPAKTVKVIDQIDTNVFDINSLQVISYGFGNNYHDILPGINEYSYDVNIPNDTHVFLRHAFDINNEEGILDWTFHSIDYFSQINTTNALAGFLPPNKSTPEGEGYVLFTIKLKQNLASGTIIKNSADIYFDYNEKIETPVWENQIDTDLPISQVNTLVDQTHATEFMISWNGSDSTSGVKFYNIYVSENNGTYYPWLLFSKDTFAVFSGSKGNTYKFYSVASDFAFNEEIPPPDYDAVTRILLATNYQEIKPDQNVLYQNQPNPVREITTIKYYLNESNLVGIDLYNSNGKKIQTLENGYKGQGYHSISLNTERLKEGIYFYSLTVNRQVQTKRLVIVK